MRLFLFILFPFIFYAQEGPIDRDLDIYKGDSHTLSFEVGGDVSNDSLMFVVKADRDDDTQRVITRRNTAGGGDDTQIEVIYSTISTILVKLTQINTEGLTAATYVYDLTKDSTQTLYTGNLKLRDEVSGSADGIATRTPYYTVALDTPSYSPSFIIGMDTDNSYINISKSAMQDTLYGITSIDSYTGANDSIKLASALTVLGSETSLYFPPATYDVGTQTIDADVILPRGAIFNNSQEITFTGGIEASLSKHFDSTVILTDAKITKAYPEWCNAIGDGNTNDIIALRNIINSGANFVNLSQDYLINDSLDITTANQIIGGNGTIRLGNSSNSHVITIASTADSVKIEGITIRGNGDNQTGNLAGILVKGSNVTIDDIKMYEARTWGIKFSDAPYGEVRNSKFYDIGSASVGSDAVQFDLGSDHSKAINNDFYNPFAYGVSGNGCDFLMINNNRVYDAVRSSIGGGITINKGGGASHGCRWSQINNNTIKTFYLIGISVGESDYTTVVGNIVYSDSSTATMGIEIAHSNYCTVVGNVINGNYDLTTGIALTGAPGPGSTHIIISANMIVNIDQFGIDAEADPTHIVITGNMIDSLVSVVSPYGKGIIYSGGYKGIVNNNMVSRVNEGIMVSSANEIIVNGNFVQSTVGGGGIRLNDADEYIVTGNKVDSAGIGAYIQLGANDTLGIIENNFNPDFLTNKKTLSATGVFYSGSGHKFILQTNGADKNFNPANANFPMYFEVTILNIDTTYNIIFDSSGLNQTIAAGQRAIFMFDGSNWLKIYLGS